MDYKKIVKSRSVRLAVLRAFTFIPDKPMISVLYRLKTGHRLNLKQPKRYTEKLQWYKLNYHDPLMTSCVDKYDVRAYIASLGLEQLLIPCYGVFESPKEIDYAALPDKFVLKDTLGSGGNSVIVCTDKASFNWQKAMEQMQAWVDMDPRKKSGGREWPYYTGKRHRIIIEQFLESDPEKGGLIDYKFFCFNGHAECLYGIADRVVGKIAGFGIFDRDFNLLPYTRDGENKLARQLEKPANYDELVATAEKISSAFPHARIDLYDQDGKIQFGEITFYSGSGYIKYSPDSFDEMLGEKFVLPKAR